MFSIVTVGLGRSPGFAEDKDPPFEKHKMCDIMSSFSPRYMCDLLSLDWLKRYHNVIANWIFAQIYFLMMSVSPFSAFEGP
jgi:hypothetical protein